MTKTIVYSLITAIGLGIIGYYVGEKSIKSQIGSALLVFDDCTEECEEQPYAEYLEQKKEYLACLEHNRNTTTQYGQCILGKPNFEACLERNFELQEQLKTCIRPEFPPYTSCIEHNKNIRLQLPTCNPNKPNFHVCLQKYDELMNQLIDCDSIIIANEKKLRECRIRCNALISVLAE